MRILRAEIGLPPGKNPFFEGQYSPAMTLGLFSPLLARRRPDWPKGSRTTGFLYYDEALDGGAESPKVSRRLEKFLDSGPPPVVFALGSSAVLAAGEFYRDSSQAANILGVRAVMIAGKGQENRPVAKPSDKIAVFDYLPYSKIFPRAAAVVHHGGIWTTAQALYAGRAMLVAPFSFDQPDNAYRVHRLGVARIIRPQSYSAARAAGELKILLENPQYSKTAEKLAKAVRAENGQESARNAINEVVEL